MTPWIRPAQPTDAGATGAILHGFAQQTDWMPKLHSSAESVAHCGMMIDRNWVTVAGRQNAIEAFLARDNEAVHALYVMPSAQGQGLGKLLLDRAKSDSDKLELWTFQANSGAQRFYLREGLKEILRTDGSGNDEELPDIFYRWTREAA